MHADEIGLAERLFEPHILNPRLFFRQTARMPQIIHFLNRLHKLMILIRRVVTQNIHIKPNTLLDESQPNPPRPNHRHGLAGNFIPQKRQIRMPVSPLQLARQLLRRPHFPRQSPHHEKRKLRRRLGQHVGGIRKRNFVPVRVRAIDVVEPHRKLRHHSQRPLARFKNLRVNRIAQCSNQPIDPRLNLLDNQTLHRRFRLRIHLNLISPRSQQPNRFSNIASSEHAKFLIHSVKKEKSYLAFQVTVKLLPSGDKLDGTASSTPWFTIVDACAIFPKARISPEVRSSVAELVAKPSVKSVPHGATPKSESPIPLFSAIHSADARRATGIIALVLKDSPVLSSVIVTVNSAPS